MRPFSVSVLTFGAGVLVLLPSSSTFAASAQKPKLVSETRVASPAAQRAAHVSEVPAAPPDAAAAPPDAAAAPAAEPNPAAPATPTATEPSAAPEGPVVVVEGAAPPRSASQIVVDKAVLTAAPHKNASELLSVVPGIFVSQHSGEGKAHQIFFRGFDALHGQDIELWAGGAPVNEVSNLHGQGYADLHFLIPELIEEVVSTPGNYDPRQGDFAVAGSVRFKLGYDEPGVTAKASLGSFGTRRYLMTYHPKNTASENFGAFELYSTDGFGPARAARRGSAMAQAVYPFGGGVSGRVLASTYAGRFDSAGVLRLSDIESGKIDRLGTYDPKQGGASSRTQVVLELTSRREQADGPGSTSWSIAPFVVLRSLELRSNFTGFLTNPTEGDSIQQLNDATTFGATASYRRGLRLLSPYDSLEAGVFLRNDTISQSQHRLSQANGRVTDDEQHPGIDTKVRAMDAAGYLDASVRPFRRLTLRGGLRGESLSYLTEETGAGGAGQTRSALGAQLAKRLSADFGLLPGLRAVASYGEGFRSPQARSLGQGETTPFTRVVSYEAGLRFRQGTAFASSLAVYRTSLSDDLVFDHTTARNELVPSTSRTGLSATLVAKPTSWFVSSTSFTYSHARFERDGGAYRSGDLLPYVPELVVRSDVAFTPELTHGLKSHFGFATTYLGRRPLPYSEFGHDIFVVDASAALRFGPLAAGLDVFNLFDASYYDGEFVYASRFLGAASQVPVRHVTAGSPRSVLCSLTLFI